MLSEGYPHIRISLSVPFGDKTGTLITIVDFFGGMLLIGLIDKLIPGDKNPHEVKRPAAAVAGIMVFISLDELLPSARAYGEHHLAIYGLVAGMAVMAISLWLVYMTLESCGRRKALLG